MAKIKRYKFIMCPTCGHKDDEENFNFHSHTGECWCPECGEYYTMEDYLNPGDLE